MEVSILIDEGVKGCPGKGWLRDIVERVLTAQGASSNTEVGLVITTQERIQELNRKYRGKDRPTDVLAFFMTGDISAEQSGFVVAPDELIHLGEVIISCPQAIIQAEEHRHTLKKELAILIIHGVLHLFGYDHVKNEMRQAMRARELEILKRIEDRLG